MSNETQKISELLNTSIVSENTILPVVAAEGETNSIDIITLRSALLFDKAFETNEAGNAATSKNDSYFVYTDATKTAVLGWMNQGGDSYSPLLDINGAQIRFIAGQTIRGLDYFTNGVNSFADLRTLTPLYSGQRIKLKAWAAGEKTGGGEFIAAFGTAADDNGSVAAGNGFYWERDVSNNDITASMFGLKASNTTREFGAAVLAAMKKTQAQGGGVVKVPGGKYVVNSTIALTLTTNLDIELTSGTTITINNAVDVFNITTGNFFFRCTGGVFIVNFAASTGTEALFRITGATTQQSVEIEHVTLLRQASVNMGYFLYCDSANMLVATNNVIAAATYPIWIMSSTVNTSTSLTANAMEPEISRNRIYNARDCITITNKGYYGCEGIVIYANKFVSGGVGLRITADDTLRTNYLPPLIQIFGNHFNNYQAVVATKVIRLFFSKNDVQAKHSTTDTVLGTLEFYSCQAINIEGNTFTSVGQSSAPRTDINTPIYFGLASTGEKNAFVVIDGNIFWIDNATVPLINFESNTVTSGKLYWGYNQNQSSGPITLSANRTLLRISRDNLLTATDVSQTLAYMSSDSNYTFSGGVLTILNSAPARDIYIVSANVVPAGSTVTQIIANNVYGRQFIINFAAAEVVLTHGANMILPDGKTKKMWLPTYVIAEFFNNQQSRIVAIGGNSTATVVSSAPTAGNSSGAHGEQFYEASTGKLFINIGGQGWRYIQTVAVGS